MAGKGDNSGKPIADRLATTFTPQLETRNFHGNVTGPNFGTLHVHFAGQYYALFAAIDEVAERIRAIGPMAPGSCAAFRKLTTVKDAPAETPVCKTMIAELAKGHETLSTACAEPREAADEAEDTAIGNPMNGRRMAREKAAWMPRARLE